MMTEANKNYTEEMVEAMTAQYLNAPTRETVDELAAAFNKSARSVISKLSALGVYKRQEAVTKTGAPIVRKDQYIAEVQEALGHEFPSMEKMTKADLERLVKVLKVS